MELDNAGIYPVCHRCNQTFYRNSKPTASVIIVKDGKVLLPTRAKEPYKGALDVVGGFLEFGEHPIDGAIREVKEETGLDVELVRMLGIYMDGYGEEDCSTLNIHYVGRVIGGELTPSEDVLSLNWVEIEKLECNQGSKNTREAIRDFKHYWLFEGGKDNW
jgi:ADP-ribose pyrophosphatase YjhB (NUDIX family)